jgi:hypothetical protein
MPIQNTRQSYSPGYFNLYIFGKQTGRQKMLHQMIADVSRVQFFLNFCMNLILIFLGCFQIFEVHHTFRLFVTCFYVVT